MLVHRLSSFSYSLPTSPLPLSFLPLPLYTSSLILLTCHLILLIIIDISFILFIHFHSPCLNLTYSALPRLLLLTIYAPLPPLFHFIQVKHELQAARKEVIQQTTNSSKRTSLHAESMLRRLIMYLLNNILN